MVGNNTLASNTNNMQLSNCEYALTIYCIFMELGSWCEFHQLECYVLEDT